MGECGSLSGCRSACGDLVNRDPDEHSLPMVRSTPCSQRLAARAPNPRQALATHGQAPQLAVRTPRRNTPTRVPIDCALQSLPVANALGGDHSPEGSTGQRAPLVQECRASLCAGLLMRTKERSEVERMVWFECHFDKPYSTQLSCCECPLFDRRYYSNGSVLPVRAAQQRSLRPWPGA